MPDTDKGPPPTVLCLDLLLRASAWYRFAFKYDFYQNNETSAIFSKYKLKLIPAPNGCAELNGDPVAFDSVTYDTQAVWLITCCQRSVTDPLASAASNPSRVFNFCTLPEGFAN